VQLGQFQIYTGDGKGKTTAAVGLAVRAAGNGLGVFMGQFIKDMEYGEVSVLRGLPGVEVVLFGTGEGCFIGREPGPGDAAAAQEGVRRIRDAMLSGRYDLVIADEINVAFSLGLLSEDDLLSLAEGRPGDVELVFTGRGAPQCCLDRADLITEMRELRHYYAQKGLEARAGIER
jgi:cob(I)alamin adenosyltransferase